jgi:hypothetical protein
MRKGLTATRCESFFFFVEVFRWQISGSMASALHQHGRHFGDSAVKGMFATPHPPKPPPRSGGEAGLIFPGPIRVGPRAVTSVLRGGGYTREARNEFGVPLLLLFPQAKHPTVPWADPCRPASRDERDSREGRCPASL